MNGFALSQRLDIEIVLDVRWARKQRQALAFTLIELLVVIAIIAILAAVLFPVFAQAQLAAKKASDVARMKQVGTAVIIYLHDYDGFYPRLISGTSTPKKDLTYLWSSMSVTGGYSKNTDIYVSPADVFPSLPINSELENSVGRILKRSSYLPNAITDFEGGRKAWGIRDPIGIMTIPRDFTNSVSQATSEGVVNSPADVVMLSNGMLEYYGKAYGCMDSLNNEVDICEKFPGVYADWLPAGIRLARPDKGVAFWRAMYPSWRKFADGANFTFTDSHVAWQKPETMDTAKRWLANAP